MIKKSEKFRLMSLTILIVFLMISCSVLGQKNVESSGDIKLPKNIILFIGDGMGLNQVQSAVYQKYGQTLDEKNDPIKLSFERFPVIGYVINFSANSLVTDSSAAGTAIASGYKTDNGMLGVTSDGKEVKSVAEYAKEKGKIVGIMSSVGFNHATPASFYAHAGSRGDYDDIIDQLFAKKFVDVLIGGGVYGKRWTPESINQAAKEANYKVFTCANINEMTPEYVKDSKVLGYFDLNNNKQLDYMSDRKPDNKEPVLSELTLKALEILKSKMKDNGFFLMVESGSIDWACHENNFTRSASEVIELDITVLKTIKFLEENNLSKDTLIIVTADHETGGLVINGPYKKVLKECEDPQIGWTTKEHSATPIMVWATGPGAEKFSGKIDNTLIGKTIMEYLK
jgi:alkaline phosphatase